MAEQRDRPDLGEGAGSMSFGEHLDELRQRLVFALLGLAPILVGALIIGKDVLALLVTPVQESLLRRGLPPTLQATGVLETFGTYVKVVLILTVLVGSPWLIWQIWRFVAPGLYRSEKRFARLLAPLSLFLTASSAAFLYYIMLPVVLAFFIGFGTGIGKPTVRTAPVPEGVTLPSIPVLEHDPPSPTLGQEWFNETLMERRTVVRMNGPRAVVRGTPYTSGSGIVQQYRISEYVGTVLGLALGFAIGFQMPVIVLLLGWVGIVRVSDLTKKRKHAALACTAAGALLTPADPLSMALMAGPLYLLFELGVLLLYLLPAKRVARGLIAREGEDAGEE